MHIHMHVQIMNKFETYLYITQKWVCQGQAVGQWFSPGTPVSLHNKTDHHDITEILFKVALSTITITHRNEGVIGELEQLFLTTTGKLWRVHLDDKFSLIHIMQYTYLFLEIYGSAGSMHFPNTLSIMVHCQALCIIYNLTTPLAI